MWEGCQPRRPWPAVPGNVAESVELTLNCGDEIPRRPVTTRRRDVVVVALARWCSERIKKVRSWHGVLGTRKQNRSEARQWCSIREVVILLSKSGAESCRAARGHSRRACMWCSWCLCWRSSRSAHRAHASFFLSFFFRRVFHRASIPVPSITQGDPWGAKQGLGGETLGLVLTQQHVPCHARRPPVAA